jgi:hypothetical protein
MIAVLDARTNTNQRLADLARLLEQDRGREEAQ